VTTTAAEQARLVRVIWIAFLLAVGIYAPVPFLLVAGGMDDAAPLPSPARSGLYYAALGAAAASFAARRWWTNSLLAALGSTSAAPARTDAWARLRAGCIITWALCEAVALIGVALALVARRPTDGVPLATAAAGLLYLHRPAAWPLQTLARAAGDAA
jgi:hypothetical protein